MTTTLLIVEDEPAIAELIALNAQGAGYATRLARSGEEALDAIRESLPDLVVLDWMLPGLSGVDVARKLRAAPRTKVLPIVMLTARAEEEDKLKGLDVGADDYLTKPFSVKELLARIKAVLRRRAPEAADDALEIGELRLEPATHRVSARGKAIEMGPAEFKLLRFLMAHPERVYSRSQLLDNVWGDHVFIEERTVDVHIRRLRAVLEPHALDNLIQTVRGTGYRMSATVTTV